MKLRTIKEFFISKWKNLAVPHQQYLLVGMILSVVMLFISVSFTALFSSSVPQFRQDNPETTLQTAKDVINPHLSWRQQIEAQQKTIERKLEEIQALMTYQIPFKDVKADVPSQIPPDEDIEALKQQIKNLQETLQEQTLFKTSTSAFSTQQSLQEEPLQEVNKPSSLPFKDTSNPPSLGVIKFVVTRKERSKKATVDNTIPSGTFAKAVLMGGVDASTSIQAANDPRPVLLRIVDKGTLPRRFKSDLKHCHIIASSYGDLSSERVMMRLEKLSCVEELTGEISETVVSGYVAGEDGKAGVRGLMVDKAGAQLRNAFVGGFLGGMGEFLTQQRRPYSLAMTPLGSISSFNPLSKGEMIKAGAGRGLKSAFEKFADFYIKRAEQLQPVLQVAAGRVVDIIFTQRSSFEETHVRQALSSIREASQEESMKNLSSQRDDMTSWLPPQNTQGDVS